MPGDTVVELKPINSGKQGRLLSPWLGHTPWQRVMEYLAAFQLWKPKPLWVSLVWRKAAIDVIIFRAPRWRGTALDPNLFQGLAPSSLQLPHCGAGGTGVRNGDGVGVSTAVMLLPKLTSWPTSKEKNNRAFWSLCSRLRKIIDEDKWAVMVPSETKSNFLRESLSGLILPFLAKVPFFLFFLF